MVSTNVFHISLVLSSLMSSVICGASLFSDTWVKGRVFNNLLLRYGLWKSCSHVCTTYSSAFQPVWMQACKGLVISSLGFGLLSFLQVSFKLYIKTYVNFLITVVTLLTTALLETTALLLFTFLVDLTYSRTGCLTFGWSYYFGWIAVGCTLISFIECLLIWKRISATTTPSTSRML